ncbi:hypothetical protein M8745_19355, partial [Lutimaribacter sp. EGI FJ00014]|nr:hypothetical protein [Lutimaribacter sp. EGI FJ00014]
MRTHTVTTTLKKAYARNVEKRLRVPDTTKYTKRFCIDLRLDYLAGTQRCEVIRVFEHARRCDVLELLLSRMHAMLEQATIEKAYGFTFHVRPFHIGEE